MYTMKDLIIASATRTIINHRIALETWLIWSLQCIAIASCAPLARNLARAFSAEMSKVIDSITHRQLSCVLILFTTMKWKILEYWQFCWLTLNFKLSADDRPAVGNRSRRRWKWLCIVGHRVRTTRLFLWPPKSHSRCRHFSLQPLPSSSHHRWFRNCKKKSRENINLARSSLTLYLKRYPPMPMLSFSYDKIWAFLESSRGAAKVTAIRPARTIIYHEKKTEKK